MMFLAGCTGEPQPVSIRTEPETDRAVAEKTDSRPVILAFGNSLTAGHGVLASESYPSQLQRALDEKGYQYHVVNQGISGDTTAGGLSRIDAALAMKPEIVILELGANDGLRGLPSIEMRRNLEEMITQFKNNGAKVVLAGLTLPRNYGPDYIRDFENTYRDLAKEYEITLIPFFLEGVAARADLNQPDGIHPTGAGYKIITKTVLETLQPLLK